MPKSKTGATIIVPAEAIERQIYLIRGHKVMLDADLAQLYGVTTSALNRPEFENWRSHFVTSNPAAKMGLRRRPHAFTEQGVAMTRPLGCRGAISPKRCPIRWGLHWIF